MRLMKRSTSSVAPVSSNTNEVSVASRVRALKAPGEPHRLDAVVALADDLDEAQLALDRLALDRQVDDPVHRHEPRELALDLLDHGVRAGGHDGDARDVLLVLGLGDRQALDVVAAARRTCRRCARARPARCRRSPRACAGSTARCGSDRGNGCSSRSCCPLAFRRRLAVTATGSSSTSSSGTIQVSARAAAAPFLEGRQCRAPRPCRRGSGVGRDGVGVEARHHRRVHRVGRREGAEQERPAGAEALSRRAPDLRDPRRHPSRRRRRGPFCA